MKHTYRPAGIIAGQSPRSRAGIRLRPSEAAEAFPVNKAVELIRPAQAGVCKPGLTISDSKPDMSDPNVSNGVFTRSGLGNRMKNRTQPTGRNHTGRALMATAMAVALALPATPALAGTVNLNGGTCNPFETWTTIDCWNNGAGPVPVTGDDVVLGFLAAPPATNANLGVQLRSITLNTGAGDFQITGAIALQNGGFITDNNANGGSDQINASIVLNGSTTFTLAGAPQILAFNGAITGTAPLTLVNTGLGQGLQLSSVNTYTGATTINGTGRVRLDVNGAIPTGSALTVNGSALFQTGSTIGSLAGGGNVFMNGNNTLTVGGDNTSTTFSGVYQNSGGSAALTKVGSGTFTLSGANTYTGGTTVNAGTLSGNTTSLQGAITNNATVIFDQAAAGTYAGAMDGTGMLIKNGTGTLTLSGANTYSGGTTVSVGMLSGTTTSLQGNIVNNSAVTFDQAANGTYAGAMSGTGMLIKDGTGTLTLSGANTYNFFTQVNAGTLSGNTTSIQGAITNHATVIFDQAANGTYAGAMVGTGSLVKSGAGILTLSGANSYNGGTTVSAGTLSGNTSSLQGAITNNAAVTFNQTTNGTYAGAMGGTGILTKNGTGTLTLSGANTYSGGTTVNTGTLSGNTTSLQGAITNNATVIFDQAANGTYAGVMSGNGGLVKSGAGILTLSGANTYSGGTTVNTGTLRAGAANAFGSGGDPLVAAGATLDFNNFNQTLGSLTGAGNIALGSATLTIGGDNADSTFSGVLSGTGGLTKNGTGKTILSGANTYTGATNINGGILSVNGSLASNVFVNSGGTLGGSGTIGGAVTVASGGIIAPGNSPGILTVNSLTLAPGSTTRMEINGLTAGTQYDQIVVNNTATLGGTLDLVFGYTPSANSRFTLIRAGNIASGFSAIQSNLGAALRASAIIDPTTFDILVSLQQSDFLPFAQTHNQRAAASMVDAQFAAWGATGLINRLNTLSAAQLPSVLGSLSGEQHAHGQSMARRLGTQFNSLLLSRLDDADGERSRGWNFWLKGLGGFGGLDSDGNAGRADNHSGGFALGADRGLGEHVVLGAAASYAHSNVDAVTAALNMDSYQLSGYGKWQRDDNYLKGTLGAGFHQTGSRRTVFEDSASVNYGNTTAGTALEAGHNLALPSTATLTPYAGMQYLHLNRTGFTETGSALANLNVREANEDSFRTLLGARLSQIVKPGWGVSIQPSLHAAWVHEHGDRVSRLSADFAAAPAAVYRVNGPQLDRSRAAVGADLVTRFSETAQLNLAYNTELAKSDDWHTLSATFEYRW